jgi:hypothetical protein
MDSLYRTPLLDCFRRGDAARDIRMMAAQGILAPRAHEQLGLLMLLVDDADPAIRAAAESTLQRIPRGDLARFLGRADVSADVLAFFLARGVHPEPAAQSGSDEPLLEEDVEGMDAPGEPAGAAPDQAAAEERREGTAQALTSMTVSQKIKAAMRGSREQRSILIRDPNRMVSLAVLSSPKVSEQDVEGFAKMASVSEDVLRVIGSTRAWGKSYSIVRALAFNPKSPIAMSMTLVNRLVEKDVRKLAADRNIAEPVKILARKVASAGQSRRT